MPWVLVEFVVRPDLLVILEQLGRLEQWDKKERWDQQGLKVKRDLLV